MRFLILFIFLSNSALADAVFDIKNIVIHKELKTHDSVIFSDSKNQQINLKDLSGDLILLNFWATWCVPCKEEMPSLDILQINANLDNLRIFPVNVGKDNLANSVKFFDELNIKNLNIYFDPYNLGKQLSLRGIPTSILINKEGKEFARIIGSIDFNDKRFINWLSLYN
jgi:thiol-disulfide isomerase/thioredoxin